MNYFIFLTSKFCLKSFAIGPFYPDTVLSSIIVSAGMLIMNGTLIQNFNLMNQLSSLDSLVVLKAGVCNITYLSATNFSMSRGPMFFSAGVNFLLAYSTFVYIHYNKNYLHIIFNRNGMFSGSYPLNGSLITCNYNTTVAYVQINDTVTLQQSLILVLPNPLTQTFLIAQYFLCKNVSQSLTNTTVASMPLVISINGVQGAVLVLGGAIFAYNQALNPLVSVQNTIGMVMLIQVTFTNNYDSEALYIYNVAFVNGSGVTCNQNNVIMGVINPYGGSCLNIRNVITTLLDSLNVIECKSLNTSAGIKIYNDEGIVPYVSMFPILKTATQITHFNFTGNYANYSLFNEIGAAIYIDSIFPLAMDYGTFFVKK